MVTKHLVSGVALCLAAGSTFADPTGWDVVKLPDIEEGFYRLNNVGQVAGQRIEFVPGDVIYRPTLVQADGTRRQLGGGVDFWGGPQDLNDHGIVVGNAWNYAVNQQRPVWWDQQGAMHFIEVAGTRPSYAKSINIAGTILGRTYVSTDEAIGWTWQNGQIDYADPAGFQYAVLSDINDAGTLVGRVGEGTVWNAAIWRNGVPELLPGGAGGDALVINEFGWIAGNIGQRAVLWRNGVLTELGDFSVTAMNNRGEILGSRSLEPVLWRDGTLTSLNWLGQGAFSAHQAYDINDRGQILIEHDGQVSYERVLALITPVPEPQQLVLLLAGLPVVTLARRQRRKAGKGLEKGEQISA